MRSNLKDKKGIIDELKKITQNAISAVIADYRGVSAIEMTALRKTARELKVSVRVVRNTILRRALQDTNFQCLENQFTGPILIAYSMDHPGMAARILKNFASKNLTFEIKAASYEGKLFHGSKIDELAFLPTYKEAIMILMTTLKEASTGKLVRILCVIKQIKKTNEAAT